MAPFEKLADSVIVAGTDGSEGARRAVSFAAGLADALGARVDLVHVVRHGGEGAPDAGEKARGEDILQAELDRLRYLGLRAGRQLLWGDPAQVLADHCNRRKEASLLVVGRRGAGGPLVRALAGSVAARLANVSEKPVVVVP